MGREYCLALDHSGVDSYAIDSRLGKNWLVDSEVGMLTCVLPDEDEKAAGWLFQAGFCLCNDLVGLLGW